MDWVCWAKRSHVAKAPGSFKSLSSHRRLHSNTTKWTHSFWSSLFFFLFLTIEVPLGSEPLAWWLVECSVLSSIKHCSKTSLSFISKDRCSGELYSFLRSHSQPVACVDPPLHAPCLSHLTTWPSRLYPVGALWGEPWSCCLTPQPPPPLNSASQVAGRLGGRGHDNDIFDLKMNCPEAALVCFPS